jgi:NAD(P)H-dependent FMN reductase
MARILFLNGSVRGRSGDSNTLIEAARGYLPADATCDEVVLADYDGSVEALAGRLRASDILLCVTGVYWSSWGSPLQRFFEVFASFELSDCFLGKPAGVLVSMDSVGGADVAQRLQGVLGWFGCLAPPLSSVVISRVGASARGRAGFEDVFQLEDIEVVVQNLFTAADAGEKRWRTWPIQRAGAAAGPYPHSGVLETGIARLEE